MANISPKSDALKKKKKKIAFLLNIDPIFPNCINTNGYDHISAQSKEKKHSAYCRRKCRMLLSPHPNIEITGYCLLEETRVCVRMLDQ